MATPFETLKRGKFAADAARLDIIISEQGVGGLVVGLPLNMDGSDGPVRPVGPGLWPQLGGRIRPCPWSSRMSGFPPAPSPAPCWKPMPRASGADEVVDKMAAAYILQGALDRLRTSAMRR